MSDAEDEFFDAEAVEPRQAAASAGVEHVQLTLPMTARNIRPPSAASSKPVVLSTPDQFWKPDVNKEVLQGATACMLRSVTGDSMDNDIDKSFIDGIVNLSMFEDEVESNNSPPVNIEDTEFQKTITAIMVKTQFLIKGWKAEEFLPDLIASYDYQINCQPGPPTFVTDMPPRQIRFTKTIIPYVYKVTIQLNISEITDRKSIEKLEEMVGMRIDKAILLERTKRNIDVVDATLKCKSVLLYHDLEDGSGVMVIGCTVMMNTQIPAIASAVLSGSSSFAGAESAQTADLTRNYLASLKA